MKIIALTGAGISKAAGIPTFEEVPHLKEKLTVEFKRDNPIEFEETMNFLKVAMCGKTPTKAHKILAYFQIPIITMNIDSLHQTAGSNLVYEVHGSLKKDNVVLYGQNIFHANDSLNLLKETAKSAKNNNEKATLLVIGTSLQTQFANALVDFAQSLGMAVHLFNQNADVELKEFFEIEVNGFLNQN